MEISLLILYITLFFSLVIFFFYLLIYLRTRYDIVAVDRSFEPEVTFLLPAYNVEKFIEHTVSKIMDLDYPKDKLKILIVNDGSYDNSLAVLKKLKKKYKNLSYLSKKNEGVKSYAVNYGLKHVKTDYVCVMDADTFPKRDLLRKVLREFKDKKIMAVTCKMLPINTDNLLGKMQFIEYSFTSFYRSLMHSANSLHTTPAFTAFRTKVFKEVGYFDPGNLTEDLDMGLRIQKAHYDVGFVIDSAAFTIVPSTFKLLSKERIRWTYGMLYNLKRHKDIFGTKYGDLGFFLLPSMLVSVFIVIAVVLLAGYNLLYIFIDFIRRWSLGYRPDFFDINWFSFFISLTNLKIILSVILVAFSSLSFFLIKRTVKENVSYFGSMLYLFLYSWLLAYFYIVSITRFVLRKKPEW